MKSWALALISIGLLVIMVAPTLATNYLIFVIEGLALVAIGAFLFLKKKKD